MNTSTEIEALSSRFAALKKLHNREIKSKERDIKFPLWALLLIHYKAHRFISCSCSWAERSKSFDYLTTWLSPIIDTNKITHPISPFLVAYTPHELGEMEHYLSSTGSYISEQDIMNCTVLEVLPRMFKQESEII